MKFEVLASDLGATEGPVFGTTGDIFVTSMDRGHLYKLSRDGDASRVVNTGGGPNGLTEGLDGNLYIAQNGGHGPWHVRPSGTGGVQVLNPDGRLAWVTQDLVSPNDLCFGPDGALYVTDPTRRPTRDDGRLWRVDPTTSRAELLTSLPWYPNGIAFGLDDDHLYVASTGDSRSVRFELADGVLGTEETVLTLEYGHPDGFAFDTEGNIIVAAIGTESDPSSAGQVQVWSPDGKLLDVYKPGPSHYYTNVALSTDGVLILTDVDAGQVLIIEDWPTRGIKLHPLR